MKQFLFMFLILPTLVSCVTTKNISDKQEAVFLTEEVVSKPGKYQPANGRYRAEISIDSLGGFANLTIRVKNEIIIHEVKDVTGMSWATDNLLIYSVSPIYGNPGIYVFDCATKETSRIVAPRTIDDAYPNGADYFELFRLFSGKVFFYYAPDVDTVDFNKFRTIQYLFQVNLDDNELKKVEP